MNIGTSMADPESELYGLICAKRRGALPPLIPGESLTLCELLALSLLWDRRSKYGRPTVETERRNAA